MLYQKRLVRKSCFIRLNKVHRFDKEDDEIINTKQHQKSIIYQT